MIDYPCDYPACTERSVIISGSCDFCHRHLCEKHLRENSHSCGKEDYDPIENLKATDAMFVRLEEVLKDLDIVGTASRLRPGHTIKPVELKVRSLPHGNRNVHVPLEFDDGVKWIARVQQIGVFAMPRSIARYLAQGEMDMLEWLHETGAAPVSKVVSPLYTHGATDFFIMEALPGKACEQPIWDISGPGKTVQQTITDLAQINIRRSQHPFRPVGSLYRDGSTGQYNVGPLINPVAANTESPHFDGPFKTAGEKYRHIIDHIIDNINAGRVFADDKEKALLVHRWIREVVSGYPPYNVEEEDTYVVHEDTNGGFIMADEEGRVTGLIDWEWATVGSKCEAFAAPIALVDNTSLFRGINKLSFGELELIAEYNRLGRPDLADCVVSGKVYQWLNMIIGVPDWSRYCYLKALGEAAGLDMEETMEGFLAAQKIKQGVSGEVERTETE